MKLPIPLVRALPALLAGFIAAPAAAVYLDATGIGQALLYPYYTVRAAEGNAFNTYISVANTADQAVVAKVRFREGRDSRLVAEFNLYLAGIDMWTAALVPNGRHASHHRRPVVHEPGPAAGRPRVLERLLRKRR